MLQNYFCFQESCELFLCLYNSWCHSPVATISLCFLTQNYSHASKLLLFSGELCYSRACTSLGVTVSWLQYLSASSHGTSHTSKLLLFSGELWVIFVPIQVLVSQSSDYNILLLPHTDLQSCFKITSVFRRAVLFSCLYKSWCHSPLATISLCFLTQNYSHTSKLLLFSGELRVIFVPVQVLVSQSSGNNISLLPHTELQSCFKITAYFVSFKTFQLHLKVFYSSMFSPDCDISKSLKKGTTVNFLNIRTPKKIVVITLKFELCGSTME